jgi:molybdenum cofactor guanylyltransferase
MAKIDPGQMLGLVLAGGQSTRMKGPEKSLIEVAQAPLIRHVADRLTHQVNEFVVNANGNPARFAFLDVPVIADRFAGFAGPLAGVHAGLAWAVENRPNLTHVLSVAADSPFFPPSLATDLGAAAKEDDAIVLAASFGRRHPVFGLWPVALAADLGRFLSNSENRKVMLFVQRYAYHEVDFAPVETGDGNLDPFFNINTPQDLQWASGVWEKIRNAS